MTKTCRYCERVIVRDVFGSWIDPEATGDDSLWRETCDANDTFEAYHEPAQAEWYEGDGVYVEGRVPGAGGKGYVTKIVGPFTSYRDAAEAGHVARLGGARTFEVKEGRRKV